MERRKRTSMYDPYREDIVATLDAGKTIRVVEKWDKKAKEGANK